MKERKLASLRVLTLTLLDCTQSQTTCQDNIAATTCHGRISPVNPQSNCSAKQTKKNSMRDTLLHAAAFGPGPRFDHSHVSGPSKRDTSPVDQESPGVHDKLTPSCVCRCSLDDLVVAIPTQTHIMPQRVQPVADHPGLVACLEVHVVGECGLWCGCSTRVV